MEWIGAAALVPLLVCGGMCVAGMVAAAVGLRRRPQPPREQTDDWLSQPAGTSRERR